MNFTTSFELIFPREYMRGALVVSLLSVWVLVALFYYLNRYTKRQYFTTWTTAWLFYALWLTLGINLEVPDMHSHAFALRQWCVGVSAIFLLWGGLQFMEKPVWQSLFAWFIVFMLVWSYASPMLINGSVLFVQLPMFVLVGLASIFAGFSFYRLRKERQYVGVGLLFMGFTLWGLYLITYPFSQKFSSLNVIGLLVSAVLQLFIAVSMIVLVLEEVRFTHEQTLKQIQDVKSEKESLQLKILSTEEQCRSLFQEARLHADLRQAYDELRQTQQSVVQQERLRALGQMASGMAHDINNAVSPILAFSELMLQHEPSLTEPARKHLGYICTAAEDIAQMVARMSEFYRRREQKEQLRLVDVNKVVQEVIELTRPRWRDISQSQGIDVQIKTEFAEGLPELYCNVSELREGMTNIVLNSVDALTTGGVITFATRAMNLLQQGPDAGVPDHVIIEIKDNGMGMDEATRQRCLEPFFSTKRLRGGTGLGLAMVYGMMERHLGKVDIESEQGRGTHVRLSFPLRQAPVAQPSAAVDAAPPSGMRVLCVDDEPLLREMLKEMLVLHKNKVTTTDGGQAALDEFRAAQKRGEPYDVVITDLGMPEVDGRLVAENVKSASPKTPVIMLTGWAQVLDEKLGDCTAVDAVVSKPPRVADVLNAVNKVRN